MSSTSESGYCIALGGTNARIAICEDSDIKGFEAVPTPSAEDDLFVWMARRVLDAADNGSNWVVSGFPGPVSDDGRGIGPMMNIPGLALNEHDLIEQLSSADPAVGRLIDEDFTIIAVNDGELAAQAAAAYQPNHSATKVAALILGTGVGSGIVLRDELDPTVFRANKANPSEIGHIALSGDPLHTYENLYSGPAIEQRYWESPKNMDMEHVAWSDIGQAIGRMALSLGLIQGVDVVVPTGGVGAGASDKYSRHMNQFIDRVRSSGNGVQRKFMPSIITISPSEAQVFEMYGAVGVARDFLSRLT